MARSEPAPAETGSARPSLSIILPTCGRVSLRYMLNSIKPQLGPLDECLVIGDGPQPEAFAAVCAMRDARFVYFETKKTGQFGNFQRDFGMAIATGDFLMFCDDDDVLHQDALDVVRAAVATEPNVAHSFLAEWRDGYTRGDVGAAFVPPNIKEKLGKWDTDQYEADQEFIAETCFLLGAPAVHHHVPVYRVLSIEREVGLENQRLAGR